MLLEGPAGPSSYVPQPRPCNACRLTQNRFGLFPVRSPLLRESLLLSLPEGTEMFQFPSFASLSGYWSVTSSGLPHSDVPGSKPVSGSPRLIAAVHVLHRLSTPRHPPRALSSFSISLRHVSMTRDRGSAHDRACAQHRSPFGVRKNSHDSTSIVTERSGRALRRPEKSRWS